MVPVEVYKSEWMAKYGSYAILLREIGGERTYPIFVDELDAQMVSLLEEQKCFLPYTSSRVLHDLLDRVDVSICRVDIFRQFLGDVLAKISFHHKGKLTKMICQPAPALELALRCNLEIRVQDCLMYGDTASHQSNDKQELAALKDALIQAIKSEAYEDAARLRDQISRMEKRQGQGHGESH